MPLLFLLLDFYCTWEKEGDFPCLSFKKEGLHIPNFMKLVLLVPIKELLMTFRRLAKGDAWLEIPFEPKQFPSPGNGTSGFFQKFRHWKMSESSLETLRESKQLQCANRKGGSIFHAFWLKCLPKLHLYTLVWHWCPSSGNVLLKKLLTSYQWAATLTSYMNRELTAWCQCCWY